MIFGRWVRVGVVWLAGMVAFAAWVGAAQAWGPVGHRTVARIAERHLDPRVRAEVAALAGPGGLASVAVWADEVRGDPRYTGEVAGSVDTRPWHYINARDADDYGRVLAASGRNGTVDHIVEAIVFAEGRLADASAADRAEALRWLVHFIGDLHQPLHVGYAEDRGGNTIAIEGASGPGESRPGNLHRLWDMTLVEALVDGSDDRALAARLDRVPLALPVGDDLHGWVREGIALRGEVYRMGGQRFGPDAEQIAWPEAGDRARWGVIVEWRLLLAGHRLAARLNAVLGGG